MNVDAFALERPRLVSLAYRVLGDLDAAEDVVQEAWLRVVDVPEVEAARAFLSKVVVRLCLDQRRSEERRAAYAGPWLPEPWISEAAQEDGIALAEDLSLAAMRLLESLSPLERAAFVLHDVAGCSFGEIAATLERTEEAVRQLARRARTHLESGTTRRRVGADEALAFTGRFLEIAASGDTAALAKLLAPDAVLHTDHGGRASANIRDIVGAAAVAKALVALGRITIEAGGTPLFAWLNGQPAVLGIEHDRIVTASILELDATTSPPRLLRLDTHRNPEKLARLEVLRG